VKCPHCSFKVDFKNFTADAKGDEYYVCPECQSQLVHQMGYCRGLFMAVIGLPILYFFIDLLLAILIGPMTNDMTIIGVDVINAVSLSVSIVVVICFIAYSIRLVRK
jgi:DNA-directed RNA polymerase subunit RPC12/RpoP